MPIFTSTCINKRSTLLFVIILLLNGCLSGSGPATPVPPETESEALNDFVRNVPWQQIKLDDVDVQEIHLDSGDMIISLYDSVSDSGRPILSSFTFVTLENDRFIFYDFASAAMYEANTDGEIRGPLTRAGRGPGEHSMIRNLKSNRDFIFADDVGNARINRYTHELVSLDPLLTPNTFMDLNDELMLMENQLSRGIAPPRPEQGRIAIVPVEDPVDTLTTILPRIIPAGYQHQSFNNPTVSINRSHEIVGGYIFLPWLFLFDDTQTHVRTLVFEYSGFHSMDIPPLVLTRSQAEESYGGHYPFIHYRLMNNGELFIVIRRALFRLERNLEGAYRLAGRYRFYITGEEEALRISDMFLSEDETELYITSPYALFRFQWQD